MRKMSMNKRSKVEMKKRSKKKQKKKKIKQIKREFKKWGNSEKWLIKWIRNSINQICANKFFKRLKIQYKCEDQYECKDSVWNSWIKGNLMSK